MSITLALLLASLSGVVTMYDNSHAGNPLYCDTGCTNLTYRDDLSFVAIPVELYSQGWLCGDDIIIFSDGGKRLYSKSYDAGPFGNNCVMQENGECLPILADIPEHLWPYNGISKAASILNVSLANRMIHKDCKVQYIRK